MEESYQQPESAVESVATEQEHYTSSSMSASIVSNGSDTSVSLDDHKPFAHGPGDINTAAALRAQYAIDTPKPTRRRRTKKTPVPPPNEVEPDDVPLVDNTASLPPHSKKTERLLRKAQKKSLLAANVPTLQSLPSELLLEILSYLPPRTLFHLLRTTSQLRALILANEASLCQSVIRLRYATLSRSFPLPIPFATLSPLDTPALLNPKRLEMLHIHRRSYHHHIPALSPTEICTCMTCVFAWNNLTLILDLHHWQTHLDRRDPIPLVPRGSSPAWNVSLLVRHAATVRAALVSPLVYTRILEKHLDTITRTVRRNASARRPRVHTHARPPSLSSAPLPSSLAARPPLYQLTPADVAGGTDAFLARPGPPSYDFPYHRDVYYGLEAYVPNRKWSGETRCWYYYAEPPVQHERDLEWVRSWGPRIEGLKEGILNVRGRGEMDRDHHGTEGGVG